MFKATNVITRKPKMTKFVVYQVEWGADIDGTGPERWIGQELGRFDTEEAALDYADNHWEICEIYTEEE